MHEVAGKSLFSSMAAACRSLRDSLAACERAVSGRCPDTSKACDRHRDRLKACEKDNRKEENKNTAASPSAGCLPGSTHTSSRIPVCGEHHCAAIADALGVAFSWALHDKALRFGALGWGREREKKPDLQLRQALPMALPASAGEIVDVAAGNAHTALVDKNGALYVCGSDRWLQLGQDAFWGKGHVWQREPVLVSSLSRSGVRIVSAACGADHTLALDTEGRVWGFGYGEHGQLFGDNKRPFTSPPTVSAVLSAGDGGAARVWAQGHCSCALGRASGIWKCVGKCADADPA